MGEEMPSVVSIKVPVRIKQKMEKLKGKVDWPDEIRRFIADRVAENERAENVEKVEHLRRSLPILPSGTVSGWVRKDRDTGH